MSSSSNNKRERGTPPETPEKDKDSTRLHREHMKRRRLNEAGKVIDVSLKKRFDRANDPTYYYKKEFEEWRKVAFAKMLKTFGDLWRKKFKEPDGKDKEMIRVVIKNLMNKNKGVKNNANVVKNYRTTAERKNKAMVTYNYFMQGFEEYNRKGKEHIENLKRLNKVNYNESDGEVGREKIRGVEQARKIIDTDKGLQKRPGGDGKKSPVPWAAAMDIDTGSLLDEGFEMNDEEFNKMMFERWGGRRKKKYTKRKGRRRGTKKKRRKRNLKKRTRRRRRKRSKRRRRR